MSRSDDGFSGDDRLALNCAIDEIIPPSDDGSLPGAGQIDVATYIDRALQGMPELREIFAQALVALHALAERRYGRRFAMLSPDERATVLREHASSADAFPPMLMLQTYIGYYQHDRVSQVLGLGARPPHPQGYEMQPNDLTLLDPVRRRAPMYRKY